LGGGTAQGTSNKDVIGSDFAVDTLTATQSGGDFIEISVFWKNYINLGTYDVSKTWYEYCSKNY
jgi:hypothetical protein